MKTKKTILFSLLFMFYFSVFSQSSSIALGFGPNKMSGDIGGNGLKSLINDDMGYGASFGYRYVFPFNLGFRIFGDYESYRGKDTKIYNDVRKHYFTSSEKSFGGQLEYVFLGNHFEDDEIPHSIYMFGGAKYVMYNSLLDGTTKYNEKTSGVFGGIGYQYRFSEYFSIGFEMKQTLYLSDKIDAYFPDISSNKYTDTAFNTRILISYYIPIYQAPKHWNINF